MEDFDVGGGTGSDLASVLSREVGEVRVMFLTRNLTAGGG